MKRQEENKIFLLSIAHSPTVSQRQALIRTANKEQTLALAEVILNTLQGKIKFPKVDLEKLKPYKKHLRKAASTAKSKWTERKASTLRAGKVVQHILHNFYQNQ